MTFDIKIRSQHLHNAHLTLPASALVCVLLRHGGCSDLVEGCWEPDRDSSPCPKAPLPRELPPLGYELGEDPQGLCFGGLHGFVSSASHPVWPLNVSVAPNNCSDHVQAKPLSFLGVCDVVAGTWPLSLTRAWGLDPKPVTAGEQRAGTGCVIKSLCCIIHFSTVYSIPSIVHVLVNCSITLFIC